MTNVEYERLNESLKNDPDRDKVLAAIRQNDPCIGYSCSAKPVEVGERVFFGCYMQSQVGETAPVEWIVLKKESNKALLLSKYILDCVQYHWNCRDNFTWETSDIRKWLNKEFMMRTFSPKELNLLVPASCGDEQDIVFLLDIEEVKMYVPFSVRETLPTPYAHSKSPYCWWWLRGHETGGENGAPTVDYSGCIVHGGISVECREVGVRPAIWVNL